MNEYATHQTGNIMAHPDPLTCHARGTRFVAQITMPARSINDTRRENQNLQCDKTGERINETEGSDLFKIFGISLKKFDLWTSFTVADQVIL